MPDFVSLHGRDSSLVLETSGSEVPLWRYWGPRLRTVLSAVPPLAHEQCHRGFNLDEPARLSVFPGSGLGWFGRAAIEAHRNGRDFTCAPQLRGIEHDSGNIKICLEEQVIGVEFVITLALDPETDVITMQTTLINHGVAPLTVDRLASAVLLLPQSIESVRYFGGRHAIEFESLEDKLGKAVWSRTNRHGLTSHEAFPGAVAMTAHASEHNGLAYAAQLAWSGNHWQEIEWLDDGRRQWQLGLGLAPGELLLEVGQSYSTPPVHASCSVRGAQGAAANFHAAARKKVRWPDGAMSPRPVHFNTWEGCYFEHDENRLMMLADKAAALGVERFVLDDGWFEGRHDDTSSLGDWRPDRLKYPNGLGPVARYVSDLGMQFGLWVEPEMVNPDSELFRAHPDWALQLQGRPVQTGRNQLVLDLARPEVSDYLFGALAKVFRDLPLSYVKWDHNRDLVAVGGADGTASYRRQTEAFYALLDRFNAAFPRIEFESCAGGGGRIDMGVLSRVHRFWVSDNIDALSRLDMQRGFLQFLPPELMGSHIGTAPAHTTGRSQPLAFRAAVACQGHLGIELNLDQLSAAEAKQLAEWIIFYKAWRHILHDGVWTGTLPDGMCWHASGTCREWLTLVYRTEPTRQRFMPTVPLPFVDREATYAVSRLGKDQPGTRATYDGSWLCEVGLAVPPTKAERVTIFHGIVQDV